MVFANIPTNVSFYKVHNNHYGNTYLYMHTSNSKEQQKGEVYY